jgi:hypothetical protein
VGRLDEERNIPNDSDSSSDIVPGSSGHDRRSQRTIDTQIAHFEQTALSEIRALQAKIDQLTAVTITERIASLEKKINLALDKLAEMAQETQAVRAQAVTTARSEARASRTSNAFAENPEADRPFETVPPPLMSPSQPWSEPATPILTAAEIEPNTLLESYHAERDASQEQKKQLQQRISADIERVRAELRKRAGMAR